MASDDGRARRSRRPGSAFVYLVAFVALLLVTVALISRDRVPIDHLDTAQAYFDRRDVLNQKLNDFFAFRVRRYSQKEKLLLGGWNSTESHRLCIGPSDAALVWVLKTPKAASSTLQDLIVELGQRHPVRYVVNTRQLRVDWERVDLMAAEYARSFGTLQRRTVYSAHGWFLDMQRWGYPRPVYIGTIRLPLVRLLSHYNYLHFGPRSIWSVSRHGQDTTAPSFDDCISEYLQGNKRMAVKWKCMQWANIQLKYFCGYNSICREATSSSYTLARENMDSNFLVVLVVERFAESLSVLEKLMPSFFSGISSLFLTHGMSRVNGHSSESHGSNLTFTPAVRNFIEGKLRFEHDLYLHSERRLLAQRGACAQ